MVQGNAMRSGATLEAVAAGEVTAPEMEIAKTPRTGISNTYRVATVIPENEAINNTSWNRERPKAKAQPEMEVWAANLIGDPEDYVLTIRFKDENDDEALTEVVTLGNLNVCALDLVFMGEAGSGTSFELESRIIHAVQEKFSTDPIVDGTRPVLDFEDPPQGDSKLSFMELMEKLAAIQKLIANSRPLLPSDLMLAESASEDTVEYKLNDLKQGVDQLEKSYDNLAALFKVKPHDTSAEFWDILETEPLNEDFYLHELPKSANLEALAKVFFEAPFPGESLNSDELKNSLY